ncbi:MAG: hypothetical protein J7L25_06795 [Deltaproteobacteria bacterium]|nr:hypothetical protein [Candidatus Tharpella aukensis]
MALSGVEVIGVGPQELTLSRESLMKLIEHSPINVVSANIPGLLPYVRFSKDRGALKVLVTSVMDPEVLPQYDVKYDGEISEPISALKRIQKEIDHDLFIVIVHAMGERISTIINSCPGIDLVIDGLTQKVNDNLDREGVVPLLCNNRRGQYIAYVDYRTGAAKAIEKTVVLRAGKKSVKEDPEIKNLVHAYNLKRNEHSRKIREKNQQEKLHAMLQKNPPNLYLGDQACLGCHLDMAENWRETRHARALATLEKKGRENDVECLRCHVTGMHDKHAVGGFASIQETPWMTNVQCESCHGPGANHAQNPSQKKMKMAGVKSCLTCHTEVVDPGFDFKTKFLLLNHSQKVE